MTDWHEQASSNRQWKPPSILKKLLTACAIVISCTGCAATKMSPERLNAIGLHNGIDVRAAVQKLEREEFQCHDIGKRGVDFDCTKMTGFLITCIHRIVFNVIDEGRVANLTVRNLACVGTP